MKKKLVLFIIIINVFISCLAGSQAVENKEPGIKNIISSLPGKYGKVDKVHFAGEPEPWIIYIKDYHCQYEVQRKINDILYYLRASLSHSEIPICIEGAVGEVDTSLLTAIPDSGIKNDVSDYFLKKGKMSGAELYSVINGSGVSLIGVDDVDLYNLSYDLYSKILSGYLDYSDQVDFIDHLINEIQTVEFSGASENILKHGLSLFGDFSFESFILETREYWQKLPAEDVPESFIDLFDALNKKNNISHDRVIALEKSLFERVCSGNNQEKIKPLVKQYMLFQLGQINESQFLENLINTAEQTGCFTDDYTDLKECSKLLKNFNNIDKDRLIDDCHEVYKKLKSAVFNVSQNDYAKSIETWMTIKKLLSLELTRESFEKFSQDDITHLFSNLKKASDKFETDTVKTPVFSFFSNLPSLVEIAGNFYNLSIKRDHCMFVNTVNAIKSSNSQVAVLVAGGFHAEGLEKALGESGYNYAVVTPSFVVAEHKNYYQEIMLLQMTVLDSFFPVQTANRLAPRVKLINDLADPVISNQFMKETVMIAKLLCVANSSELFEQLRDISQGSTIEFRQQVTEMVKKFGNRWMRKYEEIQAKKGKRATPGQVGDFRRAVIRLIKFEEALLNNQEISLGIQITGASAEGIHVQVAFSEEQRMEELLSNISVDGSFEMQERIGQFLFNFNKIDEKQTPVSATQIKKLSQPPVQVKSSKGIEKTLGQIDSLKKAVMSDPYNTQLRIRLMKRLRSLSKFLQFAADKERKAGNIKKSLLLQANSRLVNGDLEQAIRIFGQYSDHLTDEEKNLASEYFKNFTVIRGQKISLPVTDDEGRPYVDRFGREIESHMFDDTLAYGSEPSNLLQNRLIEQAGRLEGQNKKYLASVTRSSAARLTDQNRNYHHYDIDVALFTTDGPNAYRNSHLGSPNSSYGALMDGVRDDEFVGNYPPSVTYLYDREFTDSLIKSKTMRIVSDETGLVNANMPADKITAVLVNRFHLADALRVFSEYPSRDIPVLDTKGNLLWQNAPLDELAQMYGSEYDSFVRQGGNYKKATYAVNVKNPSKIVAMSDVHSDIEGMRLTLRQAGVIDEKDNFIGGPDTVVVFNGDMIDRGSGLAQKRILDFVMKLKSQAEKNNAKVIMTLGNHETMFLSGKWFSNSVDKLYEFLNTIGLQKRQAEELRKAFQENDLFTMGVLRAEHPEAMKYIDFLWNLPIVAQVGGHVFVHGAATEDFNNELGVVLKEHPQWTAFEGIEHIFQRVISTQGFASDYFDMNFKSILTGAPEMTPPPFAEKQEIVDRFLSFFEGASILAVGHNKALGILGRNEKYSLIQRVGGARNIVKLDVGANGYVNASSRAVESRAYIVDPKAPDFVFSVSETGKASTLMRKNDTRFRFMRTEAAALYDTVLEAKSKDVLNRKDVPDPKDKPAVSEYVRLLMNFQYMVFADSPDVMASSFKRLTLEALEKWPNVLKRPFDRNKFPEVGELQDMLFLYLEKLYMGELDFEDVSLSNFLEFSQNHDARLNESITTKVMSTDRVVDYETDVARFYAAMSQSEIVPLDKKIIHDVAARLEERLEEANKFGYRMGLYIQEARHFLVNNEKLMSFRTLRSYDGKPGIFIGDDGEIPIMGFVLKDTAYLSNELVTYLWNQYNMTDDIEYLDRLAALLAHEIHEYTSGKDVSKGQRKILHEEAEEIERFLCGKGNKGSRLDDDIYSLLDDWKYKTENVSYQAITKFFVQFRKYLVLQNNLNLYQRVFAAVGVPIEASVIENAKVADTALAILMRDHPEGAFYGIKQAFQVDPSFLLLILDYDVFTESEILELIALINESELPGSMSSDIIPAESQPVIHTISTPAPKPLDHRKNMRAQEAVGTSI